MPWITPSRSGAKDVKPVALMAAHFGIRIFPHCRGRGTMGLCEMIRQFAIRDRLGCKRRALNISLRTSSSCRPMASMPASRREAAGVLLPKTQCRDWKRTPTTQGRAGVPMAGFDGPAGLAFEA